MLNVVKTDMTQDHDKWTSGVLLVIATIIQLSSNRNKKPVGCQVSPNFSHSASAAFNLSGWMLTFRRSTGTAAVVIQLLSVKYDRQKGEEHGSATEIFRDEGTSAQIIQYRTSAYIIQYRISAQIIQDQCADHPV